MRARSRRVSCERTRRRERATLLRHGGAEARMIVPSDLFGTMVFMGLAETDLSHEGDDAIEQ